MRVDTLALTMQMQCPLEGYDPVAWRYRHRVEADGITGTRRGEIRAVCGAAVVLALGDDCPRDLDPSRQWWKPWDPDDREDRGPDEPGRLPCPECAPPKTEVWMSIGGDAWEPLGGLVSIDTTPEPL